MTEKINIETHTNSPFRGRGGMGGHHVIIAGGGTGGHIFPAIAIANALKELQPDIDILFIGAKGKMEMEKVPQTGYRIEGLDITGFNRHSLAKNLSLPFKLIKSFLQVRKIINAFKPDAVVGVGGYSTFPVLRYAQTKRINSFIHESNSFAGKANIMLGKNATKIFVATDGMEKFFPKEKLMITGNPVRKSITVSTISREEGQLFFGLDSTKKTILAIGGSLGAGSINEALNLHIDTFAEHNLQLIWQTGKTKADTYKAKAADKKNIWVNDFIKEMDMAYAAADIVISRAGAMSITELAVAAKPTIFVPYPLAAEDHQTANALSLVNKNAALMVTDKEVKEKLVAKVIELSKNGALQEILKNNIKSLAIANADEVIAGEILKYMHE